MVKHALEVLNSVFLADPERYYHLALQGRRVMRGEGPLSLAEREMIGAATCRPFHPRWSDFMSRLASALGLDQDMVVRLSEDPHNTNAPARYRALCSYARRLALMNPLPDRGAIDEILSAGVSRGEIDAAADIACVCSQIVRVLTHAQADPGPLQGASGDEDFDLAKRRYDRLVDALDIARGAAPSRRPER